MEDHNNKDIENQNKQDQDYSDREIIELNLKDIPELTTPVSKSSVYSQEYQDDLFQNASDS